MKNRGVVLTTAAPAGAITTVPDLIRHLKSGQPLIEVICGRSMRVFEYRPDWVISVPHTWAHADYQPLFLFPSREAERTQSHHSSSLSDRHIGTLGYNDNWFFSSEEAALVYIKG